MVQLIMQWPRLQKVPSLLFSCSTPLAFPRFLNVKTASLCFAARHAYPCLPFLLFHLASVFCCSDYHANSCGHPRHGIAESVLACLMTDKPGNLSRSPVSTLQHGSGHVLPVLFCQSVQTTTTL